MNASACKIKTEAFFLPGIAGNLYCIYHKAQKPLKNAPVMVVVPPFAEEMNKSRRMFSLLAARLAADGVSVMIFDLFGTGDSQGDFSHAKWEIWLDDVQRVVVWLKKQGCSQVIALGLRSGALLAMESAKNNQLFNEIILWAPVVDGKVMMTQFLRLRMAASIMAEGAEKMTTSMLRDQLVKNKMLEVAGYQLPYDLLVKVEGLQLVDLAKSFDGKIYWVDMVADEGRATSRANQRVLDEWHKNKVNVHQSVVVGDTFWSVQEITVVPELLNKTVEVVSDYVR